MSPYRIARAIIRLPLKIFLVIDVSIELFFKNFPYRLNGNYLRAYYYKKKFHSFGERTYLFPGSTIFRPDLISIGSDSSINQDCTLNPGPSHPDGGPCLVFADRCYIGPNCYFRTGNHKYDDPDKLFIDQGSSPNKIKIGYDVWVAANCIFLPGSEVGDHSVVAAGAVVSTKFPPYSVIAGNPARVVKKRK